MKQDYREKEQALIGILERIHGCVVAYSGGLDSTYLAIMANRSVKGRVICVTIADASMPADDLAHSKESAAKHGLEHIVIDTTIQPQVRANPRDRCYHCKKHIFRMLEDIRAEHGLETVLDGENASDSDDDRPGSRAAREAGVLSPLAAARLSKPDIRELARNRKIGEWARPQSACLSSRIPFGTEIDDGVLQRVDTTERLIRSRGVRMIRARVNGAGTRLELGPGENTEQNRVMLEELETDILALGWARMDIDPDGYMPAGLRSMKNGQ